MDFAEHRIDTADDPKIYVRDYAPQGGVRGLPVICLHGLTRNSADFEAVAPKIASLGRRTIAIDARGRGKSDNDPDTAHYRPDVYTGDTLFVMDTLGISRAVFVGTSMGGIMTMLAALTAPDRVSAAVLNDIGPELDPAGLKRIASYVGKSGPFANWDEMTAAVRASQGIAFPNKDDAFWRTFARRVSRERADGKVEFAYDPAIAIAFATSPDAPPPPSMVPLFEALATRPVLLVRGAISDLLSPEGVATMKRIKPDMDFVEVPNVGHAPTLEEADAWNAISTFLSKVE
ncbi:MAG TPA: alpha/beta hydrolase [Rhizomicrobium sp.]|jgi:pimeloyl-ACP methyl ester carboxylesterase|nr:alpha/beta hydrolase [Rhizomicrobium sp.]